MTGSKTTCLLIMTFLLVASAGKAQDAAAHWVDSVYAQMTDAQRIGQLFMIRAHSDLGEDHIASVKDQIIRYHVGGLCFFQGTPRGHAALINAYQVLSDVPLMVAMDAEWGGGMRFKDQGFNFPRQLTLGAIQDNDLIYAMGQQVGRQLREVGIHVNFAPVVDINNNPLNPVIGDRSFGEDKYNVTAKAYQYLKGMENAGVMGCAKHFPGHGDTDTDSHLDLPVIRHSRQRLDSLELFPFRALINQGLPAMMVAHLQIPALDDTPNLPTTLSPKVIQGLLREELGFNGLVFSDALEMKGVTKYYRPGQVELMAFLAGNDVLLLPQSLPAAVDTLTAALQSGRITRAQLEEHVKRILRGKYQLGLTDVRQVIQPMERITDQPNDPAALAVKQQLIEEALTVISDRDQIIPIRDLDTLEIATLTLNASKPGMFEQRTDDYIEAAHIVVPGGGLEARRDALLKSLGEEDVVLVALRGLSKRASEQYGIDDRTIDFLKALSSRTKVICVVFGSPYALQYLDALPNVLLAYEDDSQFHDLAIQGIFGAFGMHGKLPVTVPGFRPFGVGEETQGLLRFGYSIPERVGISSDTLQEIDQIVEQMIKTRAAPGCEIFIAKDGKVIYNRAFGKFRYGATGEVVEPVDLYDLASLTKVAATTLSLMRLLDEKVISLDGTLGDYLEEARGTNKEHLQISSLLAHNAGLKAWIPFYEETVEKVQKRVTPSWDVYQDVPDDAYCIQVAEDLYMCYAYVDTILERVLTSDVKSSQGYVYSDLGFIMFARMIRELTGQRLDTFVQNQFYGPMGLHRILFNPLTKYQAHEVVPTEEDSYFRNQRIQGHVHDMGAAMLGGVSGHAGLFANAESLGVVMQMLMNGGYYGGRRYLSRETIDLFTTRVPRSTRRGLGFDMKELNESRHSLTSPLASASTYGHTGFTGTCAWNDPETGLVYIFLSNRTYPNMNDTKFRRGEYRERVHSVIYRAMRQEAVGR